MKVYIWEDESYPVYGIDFKPMDFQKRSEVPRKLCERYKKVEKEYEEVQEELKKYFWEVR